MKATVQWMKEKYNIYNDKYFYGKLPDIQFIPSSHLVSAWGYACYHAKWNPYEKKVIAFNLSIKINTRWDIPENMLENTLLHEMIHIYEYVTHFNNVFYKYNEKKNRVEKLRYNAHGVWFLKEAARINKDGWDIQQYVSEEEQEAIKSQVIGSGALLVAFKMNYYWSNISNKFLPCKEPYYFISKTDKPHLNKFVAYARKLSASLKEESALDDIVYKYEPIIRETTDERICAKKNCVNSMYGWIKTESELKLFWEKYKAEPFNN